MSPSGCPQFAHLPSVLGDGNKKLSKRDPQSNLFLHRDRGFIPEGLLNYLALLGWGIADDHDLFSLDEMVAAFDVVDVNSNPARFDQKKADAINAEHIRLLVRGRLRRRGCATTSPRTDTTPASTTPASPRRPSWCRPASWCWATRGGCCEFLDDDAYELDPKAAAKELGPDAAPVLDAAVAALESVSDWTTPDIEAALKSSLIDGLELKPRKAFGPIRVAVTGSSVSPPLFESLELLGRDRSLARLRAAPRAPRPHAEA